MSNIFGTQLIAGQDGGFVNSAQTSVIATPSGNTYVNDSSYMKFDGVDDRVSTNFKPSGPRSYFIWIKYNKVDSLPAGFMITGTQEVGAYTYIGIQNGGAFYYYIGTAATGGTIPSVVLSANKWYQQGVVLFADGSRKVYLNGIEIFSGPGQIGNTATSEFSVGCTNNYYWVDGFIPSVMLYDRALSAAEVSQNFEAMRGRYGV